MQRSKLTASSLPYELRIGVTGHRKLKSPEAIAEAVAQLLERIDQTLEHQHETPIEWTVISPIAKGADRIVAEAVLRHAVRRTGVAKLEVISPFSIDEYRRDFDTPEDREQFDRLLAQAQNVACVDAGYTDRASQFTDDRRAEHRKLAYLHGGEAVVDGCEILIAIWNGQPASGVGGTGDIIPYSLKQGRIVLWIDADHPENPPLWIRPRTAEHHETRRETWFATEPFPASAKQLSPGYHQLAAYNRDSRLQSDAFGAAVEREAAALKKHCGEGKLPEQAIEPVIAHVLPQFVRADQLAITYQRRYIRATTGLFYLSAIAVTVVVGQILFLPHHHEVILFEILAMVGAVWLWMHCRREAWHEKWLQDRYLAERLRTMMFTLFLGENLLGETMTETALPFYSGPQNWLSATVSGLRATVRPLISPDVAFPVLKRFLIEAWLVDQRDFHVRTAHVKTHSAHRRHRLGFFLFGLTLLMAVLHFFGVGHPHGDHAPTIRVDYVITFLAILLPVWGAAVHAINTQLEFDRIAIRSARMAQVLDVMIEQAQRAPDLESLRRVIHEGEKVIGVENQEWWILLSFRKPVLPT